MKSASVKTADELAEGGDKKGEAFITTQGN